MKGFGQKDSDHLDLMDLVEQTDVTVVSVDLYAGLGLEIDVIYG